jgi:hypothetical protein
VDPRALTGRLKALGAVMEYAAPAQALALELARKAAAPRR